MKDELRELLDKQAITEKLYEYCRSMDRMDEELGKACFHEDAVADYGVGVFQGTGHGFVEMCMKAHPMFHSHAHQLANILIWIKGENQALSESYVDATLRRIDEEGNAYDIRNLGRYVDEWEKREGTWRISDRKYLLDFDQSGSNAGIFETTSKRDRSDPSYFGD